jgi:hypothetical protein
MFAARLSDVADLNRRARAVMAAAGRLGDETLEVVGVPFSPGDRVMTQQNFRRLGVINSTRGTVTQVNLARGELTFERDEGGLVTLPASYLEAGHLTHCYAMTGHKAQGMTTEKGFVLGDETLYKEWTYVAMSRGKEDNRLYVVTGVDPERDELGGQVETSGDPLKDLVRAIGRSRAKDLALDTYEVEEVRNMTTTQLREEWEQARVIVDVLPADVSATLTHVRSEIEEARGLRERQRELKEKARGGIEAMGPAARVRNRGRVRELRCEIARGAEGEARLDKAIKELETRETELVQRADERERWLLESAPQIRRLDALGRELWWREQQQALAVEVMMPQYLMNAVGERPMKPSERAAWHESVHAIESYRQRWGVKDELSAFGEVETDGPQRRDRDRIEEDLSAAMDRTMEDERQVLERAIEL